MREQIFKHMNSFHIQTQGAQDRIATVVHNAPGRVLRIPPWAKLVTGADMILRLEAGVAKACVVRQDRSSNAGGSWGLPWHPD